jgi:hypothetical protein
MSVGKVSQEWCEKRDLKHADWFLGNVQACDFIHTVMSAIEFTDDLIDKDKPIDNDIIMRNMMALLIRLPNNDFFINNRQHMSVILIHAASAFIDSEALKTSEDERHKLLAFHLRNFALELYHATAFCVGGWEHLRKVSVEMREFFAVETYKEWLNA